MDLVTQTIVNHIEQTDVTAVEAFKTMYCLTDEDIALMRTIELPTERMVQDYRSTYNDIREWIRRQRHTKTKVEPTVDWDDVVFEVDLLKSQEINLDYILKLVFEHSRGTADKAPLVEEVRNDNPTVTALREIAAGQIGTELLTRNK